MILLAHRGASHAAPENTLTAFARAFDEGADGLECDLRLSADGVPVVFHDAELARLTGNPGSLAALTARELGALRVQGEPIPTLADLVDFLGDRRLVLNLELKPLARPAALVEACLPHLARLATTTELILSSFDPRALALLASRRAAFDTDPAATRLALIFDATAALSALAFLPDADDVDLHPHGALLDATSLAAWSRPTRRFRPWTIDDPNEARRLLALDPDLALITNRPGPLRAELSDLT